MPPLLEYSLGPVRRGNPLAWVSASVAALVLLLPFILDTQTFAVASMEYRPNDVWTLLQRYHGANATAFSIALPLVGIATGSASLALRCTRPQLAGISLTLNIAGLVAAIISNLLAK